MHIHLNPIGGLAGDMFCAALLDLRPELLDELQQLMQKLQPPAGLKVGLEQAPGNLHGKRFHVQLPEDKSHGHHHTHYSHIRKLLEQADLPSGTRDRAQAILHHLAEAEAWVHGTEVDAVAFHEVGNWDSIVDIVSAAFLLETLQIESCSCEPLPKGGGRVMTEHGWLPVPAPATARLLEGMPLHDDGVGGGRITPTGSAILCSLQPAPMKLAATLLGCGYGFGRRAIEGIPNCVQIQLLQPERTQTDYLPDRVIEVCFEVDDQSPEDLAHGLDRIREQPGVLSVLTLAAIGKLGRQTQQIQILVTPEHQAGLFDACFHETSTIGLRYRETSRWTLHRQQQQVEIEQSVVGVKLCQRPDGMDAKAEQQDLNLHAGRRQRQRVRQQAETQALQSDRENDDAG
mgnify:CR=1 FL=1